MVGGTEIDVLPSGSTIISSTETRETPLAVYNVLSNIPDSSIVHSGYIFSFSEV